MNFDLILLGLFVLGILIALDMLVFNLVIRPDATIGEQFRVLLYVSLAAIALDLALRYIFGVPLVMSRLIIYGVAGLILADKSVRRKT
ncbi:hypothetical protein BMS3Bbin04_00163 [bacterium BMS3Bbin04]|nr:hypothetical protein BMS3Bbin04_00163 [bacterium BMS3Bbin04]